MIVFRKRWWPWFFKEMVMTIVLFRKRCMDLVSFETRQEYDWVKGFIDGGVNIISNSNILRFLTSHYWTPIHTNTAILIKILQRCLFSGRPGGSATLMGATSRSSSLNWSTGGSGQPTRSLNEDQIIPSEMEVAPQHTQRLFFDCLFDLNWMPLLWSQNPEFLELLATT